MSVVITAALTRASAATLPITCVPDVLGSPVAATMELAHTPTRLDDTPDSLQERLINWGYAICDAALRAHVEPHPQPPTRFPYPDAGVGTAP
jgi:NTE family protein